MTADWRALIEGLVAGTTDPAVFHDAFLALWRQERDQGLPAAIEELFYVVEAFTPDPALRDSTAPWEADEAEVLAAARTALAALEA